MEETEEEIAIDGEKLALIQPRVAMSSHRSWTDFVKGNIPCDKYWLVPLSLRLSANPRCSERSARPEISAKCTAVVGESNAVVVHSVPEVPVVVE